MTAWPSKGFDGSDFADGIADLTGGPGTRIAVLRSRLLGANMVVLTWSSPHGRARRPAALGESPVRLPKTCRWDYGCG
jgi:hypothetical protein